MTKKDNPFKGFGEMKLGDFKCCRECGNKFFQLALNDKEGVLLLFCKDCGIGIKIKSDSPFQCSLVLHLKDITQGSN